MLERRVRKVLSGAGAFDAFGAVLEGWAAAEVVYRGPVGYSADLHFDYRILLGFLTQWRKDAPALLESALADSRDVVVAYSLVALGAIGVGVAPGRFAQRERPLRWRLGCQSGASTLSEFAELSCEQVR